MAEVDKYFNLNLLSEEEAMGRVKEAPEECPITGLRKIDSYYFDEGVVYAYSKAYDAYTLPAYDPGTKEFTRVKIDMDEDFVRDDETVCELDDLRGREDFDEIKKFYGIIELDDIAKVVGYKEC